MFYFIRRNLLAFGCLFLLIGCDTDIACEILDTCPFGKTKCPECEKIHESCIEDEVTIDVCNERRRLCRTGSGCERRSENRSLPNNRYEGLSIVVRAKNELGINCIEMCNAGSPWCNALPLEENYTERFYSAYDLFSTTQRTVSKKSIMDTFGQVRDGCKRGDVVVSGQDLINEGEGSCVASVSLSVGRLSVRIPEQISVRRSHRTQYTEFVVSSSELPELHLEGDPGGLLNGPISSFQVAKGIIAASIDGYCVYIRNGVRG